MARIARNGVRETVYGALTNIRLEHAPFDDRAILISFVEEELEGAASFGISFFDWELEKRELQPVVYRLCPEDTSTLKITPQECEEGLQGTEVEEDVEIVVKVKYSVGSEIRSIYFSTPISKAIFEGRMCACCRFHDAPEDHGRNCLVHGGN